LGHGDSCENEAFLSYKYYSNKCRFKSRRGQKKVIHSRFVRVILAQGPC